MKICFITTIPGTLRAFVIPQVEHINKVHPEWEITFICNNDKKVVDTFPEYINYIPVTMGRGIDLGGIKTVASLTNIFKREKFDMIVYATPNAAFYASIAGKIAGMKKRIYCQWGIRYVGFSGVNRLIFKFLEKITCSFSTRINAVSSKNRQFAINEGLYKEHKAQVVGNGGTVGVDLSEYDLSKHNEYREEKRSELGITDELVFGFVGRLSRDKGMLELFSATKKLSEEIQNIKLICIGRDELPAGILPADINEWLETTDKVIFTGRQPKEDVKKYYAAMDMYVHPTYREGFGMVLQEAAAMACPVITTNIPGASEVLVENESCLLVEPKNWQSLYETMRDLSFNKEKCQQMGAAGRKYVEERYERSIMVDNWLKRYEELLEVG